jgi:hypothetical protein
MSRQSLRVRLSILDTFVPLITYSIDIFVVLNAYKPAANAMREPTPAIVR